MLGGQTGESTGTQAAIYYSHGGLPSAGVGRLSWLMAWTGSRWLTNDDLDAIDFGRLGERVPITPLGRAVGKQCLICQETNATPPILSGGQAPREGAVDLR